MQTKRWLSRKFIVSAAAQLAAVGALIWPSHEEVILSAVQSIAALVVVGLSAMGYVRMEGKLDQEALRRRIAAADGS